MRYIARLVLPVAVLAFITGMLPVIPADVTGDSQLAQVIQGGSFYNQRQEDFRAEAGLTTGVTPEGVSTYYQVIIPKPVTTGTGVVSGSTGAGTAVAPAGGSTAGSGSASTPTSPVNDIPPGATAVNSPIINGNVGRVDQVWQQPILPGGTFSAVSPTVDFSQTQQGMQVIGENVTSGAIVTPGAESECLARCRVARQEGEKACATANKNDMTSSGYADCVAPVVKTFNDCELVCSKPGSASVSSGASASAGQAAGSLKSTTVYIDPVRTNILGLIPLSEGSPAGTSVSNSNFISSNAIISTQQCSGCVEVQLTNAEISGDKLVQIVNNSKGSSRPVDIEIQTAGSLLNQIAVNTTDKILGTSQVQTTAGALSVPSAQTTAFGIIGRGIAGVFTNIGSFVTNLLGITDPNENFATQTVGDSANTVTGTKKICIMLGGTDAAPTSGGRSVVLTPGSVCPADASCADGSLCRAYKASDGAIGCGCLPSQQTPPPAKPAPSTPSAPVTPPTTPVKPAKPDPVPAPVTPPVVAPATPPTNPAPTATPDPVRPEPIPAPTSDPTIPPVVTPPPPPISSVPTAPDPTKPPKGGSTPSPVGPTEPPPSKVIYCAPAASSLNNIAYTVFPTVVYNVLADIFADQNLNEAANKCVEGGICKNGGACVPADNCSCGGGSKSPGVPTTTETKKTCDQYSAENNAKANEAAVLIGKCDTSDHSPFSACAQTETGLPPSIQVKKDFCAPLTCSAGGTTACHLNKKADGCSCDPADAYVDPKPSTPSVPVSTPVNTSCGKQPAAKCSSGTGCPEGQRCGASNGACACVPVVSSVPTSPTTETLACVPFEGQFPIGPIKGEKISFKVNGTWTSQDMGGYSYPGGISAKQACDYVQDTAMASCLAKAAVAKGEGQSTAAQICSAKKCQLSDYAFAKGCNLIPQPGSGPYSPNCGGNPCHYADGHCSFPATYTAQAEYNGRAVYRCSK